MPAPFDRAALQALMSDRRNSGEQRRVMEHRSDAETLKLLREHRDRTAGRMTIGDLERDGYVVLPLGDLNSELGNHMVILSTLSESMRRAGRSRDERNAMLADAMSGDADHLVKVVDQHADIVVMNGQVIESLAVAKQHAKLEQALADPERLDEAIAELEDRVEALSDGPIWAA